MNNKLVYDESNGIGVVISVEKSTGLYKLVFPNGIIKKLQNVVFLQENWNDFFSRQEISLLFSEVTFRKGLHYYDDGKVLNTLFDKQTNTISASVSGEYTYNASIKMNSNRTLSMTCTCPVGRSCKHCAAALIKISALYDYCKAVVDPGNFNVSILPENISNILTKLAQSEKLEAVFLNVRKLTDILAGMDLPSKIHLNLIETIESIKGSYANSDTFNIIDIAFAADTRINKTLDTFLRSRTFYWPKHSQVFSSIGNSTYIRRNNLNAADMAIALSFRRNHGDSNDSLQFILTTQCMDSELTEYLIRFFYNDPTDSDSFDDIVFSIASNYRVSNKTAVRVIHSILSEEKWHELVNKHSDSIYLDIDLLSTLPTDEQIMLLNSLNDAKQAIDYAHGNLKQAFLDSPIEAATALIKLGRLSRSSASDKKIGNLVSSLPDSEYIQAFIRNNNRISVELLDSVPYNFNHLHKYFRIDHEVSTYHDSCVIDINIHSLNDTDTLSLRFDEQLECYKITSDNHYYFHSDIYSVSGSKFMSSFIPDFLIHFGDSIEKARAEIDRRLEIKKQEKIREEMLASLSQLSDIIYNRKINLVPSQRSSMEFSFSTNISSGILLSARISNGSGKFYIIKNFTEFLKNCKQHQTVQYGKGFEFTHILSNFDDTAKKALNILLKSDFGIDYRHDKRYLDISEYFFNDLLSALIGTDIVWNSDNFRVRLRPYSFNISLDENNKISVPISAPEHYLFISGDTLYDFNNTDNAIDIIDAPEELQNLILFAFRHNGRSISPVLDRFKSDIYPRLAQYIDIPEKNLENFKLGQIEINAYFDYSDRIISLRTNIFKDKIPLTAGKLSSAGDISAYNCYQSYINMLGFVSECPETATDKRADEWLDSDAAVLSFFSMDFTELKKYCNVFLSESIRNRMLLVFQPPVIRIKYDNGIMQAFAENSDYTDSELDSILKAIRLRKKYVQLSGNRIVRLDNEESDEFADTVNDLGLDEKSINEPHQIPVSTSIRAFAHEANCRVDDYLVSMINDIKAFKLSKLALPELNAELRSYQKEGFRWLRILSDYNMGGILADDMGLGKTLEIITLLKSDSQCRPSLVVCPKSLVFNWKNEFSRFSPDTETVEIYGSAAEREKIIGDINYEKKTVYITSYDSLRNDRDKYSFSFNYLILDEAQYIKNIYAQKSQTVKTISATHKFALTGTPIENNIIDLWSIFDFILPGYFENLKSFKHRFETDGHFPEIVSKRVAPFILRRTKKDVLKDLPEKSERILSAEMSREQRKLYEAYKKTTRDKLNMGGKAFDILPMLTRLRQICVDPSMFADNYEGGSGKIDLLSELIPEYLAAGHRMLIFSQFVKGLESVEALLNSMKLPYFKLTGDTKSEDRLTLANEFNNSRSVNIFLISLKAGGTGLNLTGADTVIHLDPWWNVAAENQASDRSHRIGQQKNVEVIRIICSDSVEEKVIDLQNRKKDLVDKLISNDDSSITGATIEDIAFVIE